MELKGSKTEANLLAAFAGEAQAYTKYLYYADKARQDGYELRFRTVELWGELLEKLEENGWIAAGDE